MYKINTWYKINICSYSIAKNTPRPGYVVQEDYDPERFPAFIHAGSLKDCRSFLTRLKRKLETN